MNPAHSDSIRSMIDRCLDEFDELWDAGQNPRADRFRNRFDASNLADFVELIYQEFCRCEADGLNPSPEEFLRRYAEFRPPLEKLFAVHFGLETSAEKTDRGEIETTFDAIPMPGDFIGPYRIVRLLGQGGMGSVFLAEQTDLADRSVVLKIVRMATSIEPEHQARVNHPNVMPVYRHFGTDDGRFLVIVMPYIPGMSMDRITALASEKPARKRKAAAIPKIPGESVWDSDPGNDADQAGKLIDRIEQLRSSGHSRTEWNRQVAAWGSSVARALFAAYKRGIVHGDVKPGNIHVDSDLRPYLLDFHLSRRWKFERHSAVFLNDDPGGTLFYMPPERLGLLAERLAEKPTGTAPARGEKAGNAHRGDLYSLALVLLELLTGRQPASVDPLDTKALTDVARTLAEKRLHPRWCQTYPGFGRLPAEWKTTLNKALQPDPAQRQIDGTEFAAELDRLGSRFTTKNPIRKAFRSGSVRAAAAIGLAIVTVTIFWAAKVEHRRERQLASLVWRTPYEFWDDPSSFQTNTLARRLSSGRAELDRLAGLIAAPTRWPFEKTILYTLDARRDTELWLADRIEHLSRSLAQRALRTDDRRDADSALNLLSRGLARWSSPVWIARERAIRKRFSLPWPGIPGNREADATVAEYVELISGESGNTELDFRRWRNLVERTGNSFAVKWGYARFLARNGRVQEAIPALRDVTRIDPDHFESRRLIAQTLFLDRQFEAALREIELALAQRHDDISALRIRSILRLYVGQREELMAEIERMGEILRTDDDDDPGVENPEGKAADSEIVSRIGSNEVLDTRTVERIHELFPKDRDVSTLLARKYFHDKRIGEAIALMENLLRTGPRKTQDLINLAILYRNNFQLAKAVELGTEIVARNDFEEWLNSNRIARKFCLNLIIELEKTDRLRAIAICERISDLGSDSKVNRGMWHFQLARMKLLEFGYERLNESITHLKKSGRHHRSYIDKYYRNDRSFDAFRNAIDPKLDSFFETNTATATSPD